MGQKRSKEENPPLLLESQILADEEAKRIILALYDEGHDIAVYVIDRIFGKQLTPEEREDLIQEGFLRMVIHVEKLYQRTPQERLSYLAGAMRSVAVDECRRRAQARMVTSLDDDDFPELESPEMTPEQVLMMKEDTEEKMRCMHAALERLPERDRKLLIEKYQNGRSDIEIAKLLGIRPRNVRVFLSRARHKAAIYYGEEIDGKRRKKKRRNKKSQGKTAE